MLTVLVVIFYVVILVTVAIIIVNTTTTSKALAYLMLISLFPVVGLIVYFAIGRNYRINKLYSKKLEVDRNAFPELEQELKEYSKDAINKSENFLDNFINLAQFNTIDNVLTLNNDVKLLLNGESKFPDVLESLKNAKHHIHIEYYIYEDDEIGKAIGKVLKQKAAEGVEVRFIYDDFGSKSMKKSFIKDLESSGVEVFPFYKIKLLFFANRINYRNHRKIIVIDGKTGYVGGINISERYANPNSRNLYWRDTHLKISGSAVLSLQRVFMSDWNFCAQQNIGVLKEYFPIKNIFENNTKKLVQIVFSGPDSDHPNIMFALMQAIIMAKKEILITTPYFVPDTSFINALKIAKLSNVSIKLLVPGVSDSFLVNATSNSYYQELLETGIEVYKYTKGFVHAKTMVCDGFVSTIGTANLDQRSFDLNFEINAFVYDAEFSNELREAFLNDLKNATKLELESWKNRSYFVQFIERVARLLSPLM